MSRPFSDDEYRGRFARAARLVQDADLDACICFAPEHLYYLAGYDAHTHFSPQALVFGPHDDEPTFIHRDVDTGNAEETSWVSDRRTYHHGQDDPLDAVLQACRERANPSGRVGVCWDTYALPGGLGVRLRERLEYARVENASRLVERLRLVKSDREVAYIREAARFADLGLARAREVITPGMSDIRVAGHLEAAMREAGSEYPAMPAWVSSGPRARGAHKTPSGRVIEPGERLKMEFASVHRRYHAVTMQTLWLGEPLPGARRAYEAAIAALRAGAARIAPGVPVAEAESAAFEVLTDAGFAVGTHSRFGYGVGAAYPPTWLEGLDITRESDQVFEPNMSFVLHTSVMDPEEELGLLIGGAYLLTSAGLEILSGGDLDLWIG